MLGDALGDRCEPGDLGGRSPGCERCLVGATWSELSVATRWRDVERDGGLLVDTGVASFTSAPGSSASGDCDLGMSK
jgi:hypothetical protein